MIFSRTAIALSGFLLAALLPAGAQTRLTREEYIDRYKSIAVTQMERYGIPASITMAQGILESDSGNSRLSVESNNHFGIKCKRNWSGPRVYHDDDEKGECFRAYESVEASYHDHAEFLDTQPRYDSLFAYASTDYRSWARGLKAAGYATAPDYAQRLVRIIESYKLYLLDQPDGERLYAAGKGRTIDFTADSHRDAVSSSGGYLIDPDNFRVTINAHEGYNVYTTNSVHYIVAKENDSFKEIGRKFRLSKGNLRKFNDAKGKGSEPEAGEVVFIERKLTAWRGNARQHICHEGETLRSVSQSYGIRVRSLAKINGLKPNAVLADGMELKIK
ncbi:MAG: glucosaminidase domain-containing protein [Alistipes sp.]|nr:glucosaminidase domain-containing protein [Alistipes sp.]